MKRYTLSSLHEMNLALYDNRLSLEERFAIAEKIRKQIDFLESVRVYLRAEVYGVNKYLMN